MVEPRLLKAVWWIDCIEQFRRKIFNDIIVEASRISLIRIPPSVGLSFYTWEKRFPVNYLFYCYLE